MGRLQVDPRLAALEERGVVVVEPRQTYVDPDVSLERVCTGAILHPGTRLCGGRVFVGPGAEIGCEGPATLVDSVVAAGARVDAGYLEGAVLLTGARAGWGAHFRPTTLLEEQASTAHVVGLKHTVLLSFVTLGSVINFCDVLMAGGTSRSDHSEVGSGFIHFNFTPWGERGDKATPSLIGDVVRGVFLREPRVFLGGAGGAIGPRKIGFGAVTGAGQVLRADVGAGRLSVQPLQALDAEVEPERLGTAQKRCDRNVAYIAQLVALRAWYRQVRRPRIPERAECEHLRLVTEAAIDALGGCIAERVKRLQAFMDERGAAMPRLDLDVDLPCPLEVQPTYPYMDHVAWVGSLGDDAVALGVDWMTSVAAAVG